MSSAAAADGQAVPCCWEPQNFQPSSHRVEGSRASRENPVRFDARKLGLIAQLLSCAALLVLLGAIILASWNLQGCWLSVLRLKQSKSEKSRLGLKLQQLVGGRVQPQPQLIINCHEQRSKKEGGAAAAATAGARESAEAKLQDKALGDKTVCGGANMDSKLEQLDDVVMQQQQQQQQQDEESPLFEEWREREKRHLEYLERVTSNPAEEQVKFLERILQKNANTAFLQQCKLNGATDVETFRQRVPLNEYDTLRPYIERIIAGDSAQLLSADPVIEIQSSSGTTSGDPKLYPVTEEEKSLRALIWTLTRPVLNRIIPGLHKGKCMFFYYIPPTVEVIGELPRLTSPHAVIEASTLDEAYYCHLILGLVQREEAEAIRKVCRGGWDGAIRRLWPNAVVLDTICTGTMEAYTPTLNYYSDGLPVICTQLYASTEGYFGLNMSPACHPDEIYYTLLPTMAYYEFIPASDDTRKDSLDHEILDLASVELGQEYEILVTTVSGLYRYRVGDVLKVMGFYNKTPMMQFMRRRNTVLSIDTDKTDEKELNLCVTRGMKLLESLGLRLHDFTSLSDVDSSPGHYVIFMELVSSDSASGLISTDLLEQCCELMDGGMNSIYLKHRANENIGPLELRIVKPGTFDALAELAYCRGSSPAQYKTPRGLSLLKHAAQLGILNSHVVQNAFSRIAPPLPHPIGSSLPAAHRTFTGRVPSTPPEMLPSPKALPT
ncbi:hypothetical protein AXG93_4542s1010 [Marchantia polymorpha subsp. ruderalis]|uniref:Uncharacterized protein n=1 Tax=Marchantia polymorpha subsp. ruderalis TaxID=1480154 RepID=A0A176W0I5_MARPO|nr:hypothetical protein AXG93_4542s1010 [Marchantia polymorpha subsp. ruderalis]